MHSASFLHFDDAHCNRKWQRLKHHHLKSLKTRVVQSCSQLATCVIGIPKNPLYEVYSNPVRWEVVASMGKAESNGKRARRKLEAGLKLCESWIPGPPVQASSNIIRTTLF